MKRAGLIPRYGPLPVKLYLPISVNAMVKRSQGMVLGVYLSISPKRLSLLVMAP